METDAQKDLALDDAEAEGVVGGRQVKKTAAKSKAGHSAPTHTVDFVHLTGGGPSVDGLETTDPDDCADTGDGLSG
jgi:hypothetical protein